MSVVVLVLLGVLALLPTAAARLHEPSWLPPALQLAVLSAAGVLAPLGSTLTGAPRACALALGVAAAAGGASPVVRATFRVAGRTDDVQPDPAPGPPPVPAPPPSPAPEPAPTHVLRGGGMIGVLERTSVAAAVLTGWPAGIPIVLAVKGLARYPELRDPRASELFIIGTFTSVLWALACSGVAHVLVT